jgi:hypothetical protein
MEKSQSINIFHQNIQGFSSKELEIGLFLDSDDIQVLCITEHWLRQEQLIFDFVNFKLASFYARKSAIHGGSLIIVKESMKSKERKDIVRLSIERIVEIACTELENHIIICVYRPPASDFSTFESTMENVLKLSTNSKKAIIVCGDFNVNLLESSNNSTKLLCLFKSFNLLNLFLEPTRIGATSATCLDNIFCNCECFDKKIVNRFNSDHSGQKVTFLTNIQETPQSITYRPITGYRLELFKNEIRDNLCMLPITQSNSNNMYKDLFSLILSQFNVHFRIKTISGSKSKLKFSEWATVGIHRSRNRLYELYGEKAVNKNRVFQDYVKNYSKTFKKVCLTAKANYISSKLKVSDNKVKTVWNIINREAGKLRNRKYQVNILTESQQIMPNEEVASAFETYFSNIASSTTKGLQSSAAEAHTLLCANVNKCNVGFEFSKVDSLKVVATFKSLNLKKTEDLWGASVKVINHVIELIAPYLAFIYNSCLSEGNFPHLMKYSKVIPLFKSGDLNDLKNFRPISILPVLSKVFEKLMLNDIVGHFNRNKLFTSKQYGFTRGRSTTDAASVLIEHIYNIWENSCDAIGIFCDLTKAFDCVDHRTLIMKLKHYGLSENALSLMSSYLSNRTQTVVVNGTQSNGATVTLGVPQGSILGPFLFLVYINDLPYIIPNLCDIVLFADDTSLVFKVDRKSSDYSGVNNTLVKVLDWFTTNNLLLNAKKTKCVRFALPNVRPVETKIFLNNECLEMVDKALFLGITLDRSLQWSPHIAVLARKLSSAAYAIRKIRQLTNVETARLVYYSYFHSVMTYGILVWGKAADIQTVFVLQKRAIRSIYLLSSRESLRDRFKEINIMTVASLYIYENIIYVIKNFDSFTKNSDIHKLNTRNKNKIAIKKFRIRKVHRSFLGQCIHFFNKLPDDVLTLPLPALKKYLKKTLMSKAYYRVEDYMTDTNAWPRPESK